MKVSDLLMLREFATTLYPRSRNDWTTPAPIPCEAPVTITVFCLLAIPASLAVSCSLNSVVAGISTFGPIVFGLLCRVSDFGNGFHILQTKFDGHQQTKRCSMIHGKGQTIEVCGEQRLWMAGRR